MKELSAEEFFEKCYVYHKTNSKRDKFTTMFPLKNELLKLQKIISLSDKQKQRLDDVLDYVILQRNKQVHFHPKGFDTFAVRYEIYKLLEVLIKIFNLEFSSEFKELLQKAITEQDKQLINLRSRYEPVWV